MGSVRSVNNYLSVMDVPVRRRGAANTTYMIMMDLSTGLSGLIVGVLVGASGNYTSAILVSMFALLVSAGVSQLMFGKKAGAKKGQDPTI